MLDKCKLHSNAVFSISCDGDEDLKSAQATCPALIDNPTALTTTAKAPELTSESAKPSEKEDEDNRDMTALALGIGLGVGVPLLTGLCSLVIFLF